MKNMKYDKNLYVMERDTDLDMCQKINQFVIECFDQNLFLTACDFRDAHRVLVNLYDDIGDVMINNAICFTDAKQHFNLCDDEIIMLITQLDAYMDDNGDMHDIIEYYYIDDCFKLHKCNDVFFANYGIYVNENDF